MADKSNAGLTKTLISVLKGLMSDGSLALGSRLPPERELAERFGVHRSSLMASFESSGDHRGSHPARRRWHLSYKRCSQYLGRSPEFMIIVDGISFTELMEARLIVEPELAARAAER